MCVYVTNFKSVVYVWSMCMFIYLNVTGQYVGEYVCVMNFNMCGHIMPNDKSYIYVCICVYMCYSMCVCAHVYACMHAYVCRACGG